MFEQCRGCLKEAYDHHILEEALLSMFDEITNLKSNIDDGLPQHLCTVCIAQLNAAFSWAQKCRESDIKLRGCVVESYTQVEYLVEDAGNESTTEQKSFHLTKAEVPVEGLQNTPVVGDEIKYSAKQAYSTKPRHNPRTCPSCFAHFDNNEELLAHQELSCPESETLIYLQIHCKECSMPCNSVDNFIQHIIDQHERTANPVILPCTICNTTFSHEELLQYHIILHKYHYERLEGAPRITKKNHEEPTEKEWQCPQCGKLFSSNLRLSLHIRSLHNRETRIECDLCQKPFFYHNSLKLHKLRHHYKQANYMCTNCGRKFFAAGDLRVHLRTHTNTGDSRYTCTLPDCGKVCSQLSELKYHVRSKHTLQRDFKCSECDKNFITNQHRKQHFERNHNPELRQRNDVCSVCERRFYTRGQLTKHIRLVHRLADYSTHGNATINRPT